MILAPPTLVVCLTSAPVCNQDPFDNRNTTLLNYYKKIRQLEKPELIRFYFLRKPA